MAEGVRDVKQILLEYVPSLDRPAPCPYSPTMGPDPKKQLSVSVWLSLETNRRVMEICAQQGIKRAQFVRRAVEEALVRVENERQLLQRAQSEDFQEFMRKTQRKIRSTEALKQKNG
jgi:predicted DNA-binding protein